ncbi:phage major capsid protein, P2 family [Acinetobacter qingfengensis]|uniref:Phage major capsid protein, P2 family n=1 Tax=Acinetobacter qingfengensis TaxID=1262585 RepID=A0A1E7R9W7_9GAMM|nr:phage major capsid protein, P2 family [Acinetobacter qingfengensis]KAA8733902.1 phage major capsid protein, P2 family [Acinetobacter qingfengensis]OEY96179.1 phage major capsid protein, P2 family [Acinetobacter qingfengensis]
MRNDTRLRFNAAMTQLATLNGVSSVTEKFTVSPTIAQKIEGQIQKKVQFLGMINVEEVIDQTAEVLGLGMGSTIAGRTDTSGSGERTAIDPSNISRKRDYFCRQTNFDTAIRYNRLDMWAHKPNFYPLFKDQIQTQQGLDRIMIGWNGTSAAATTNRSTNPLLQDVNIGWLQKIRTDAPAQHMTEGAEGTGKITVGATGDYKNLDALVQNIADEYIHPIFRDGTDLVVIVGRNLLNEKNFRITNNADDNENVLAGQVLVSQIQIGGLKAIRVPYFAENAILITSLDNLSIYWQKGTRRRHIIDEPKKDQIANYESVNEDYVVEEYEKVAFAENIEFID